MTTYVEDRSSVKSVQFYPLGPKDVKKMTVCKIFQTFGNNTNFEGTLSDPKMGTTDNRKKCITCENQYKDCPGHPGYIELATPMFNIIYMKQLIKLLNVVCYNCSFPTITVAKPDDNMADKDKTQYQSYLKIIEQNKKLGNRGKNAQILRESESANVKKICLNCGARVFKYQIDKASIIHITRKYKAKDKNTPIPATADLKVTADEILKILMKIPDEQCEILGFNPKMSRPENMILTILLVPPPSVRPSIKTDNGKVSDDDLTHKYNDIIKCNNDLYNAILKDTKNIENCKKQLQYHILTLIDNNSSQIERSVHKNGGRPMKSYRERIGGKEGRFRSSLMGKRVNGSGRSVITPNPMLSIDEVGVPIDICKNLTYPEIVNRFNIAYLNQMIKNGPNYPGAKSIKFTNGKQINLVNAPENKRNEILINEGDIVYRHIVKGDVVLFNRQPSLHKMSMMAHRVVPLNQKTFSINANVTASYNADFDGDEMNMHLPQSIQSVCELMILASVQTQIVSPQASKPVIFPVQDTILGTNLLSRERRNFSYNEYLFLTKELYTFDDKYVQRELHNQQGVDLYDCKISVHAILSGVMPLINYEDNDIVILNGEIKSERKKGFLTKRALGDKEGSLIHIIFNDCGSQYCLDFINNIALLAHQYLKIRGFSCGYKDTVLPDNVKLHITNVIDDSLYYKDDSIYNLITNIKSNNIENKELLDKETYITALKTKLSNIVNEINEYCYKETSELDKIEMNGIYTMINSGSKGKKNNLAQIVGLLGLQEVNGTWIENQFYRRTLPHFCRDDITPESHGFILNSFSTGLNPIEYFFHAASGREGVINKTITTADTGYIQRRFFKILEELHCCEDGTIRNSNGVIIQMCYANDGFDCTYQESQDVSFVNWSKSHVFAEFGYNDSDIDIYKSIYHDPLTIPNDNYNKQQLNLEFEEIYNLCTEVKKTRFNDTKDLNAPSPVNFKRIIDTFVARYNLTPNSCTNLTPLYIYQKVKELKSKIKVCKNSEINKDATLIFRLLISVHLSSRWLLNKRFNIEVFEDLIKYIYVRFITSLLNPGENVGAISAQSLGEPTTQLSLDAFHNIGFEADGPSGGVGRLRECMGLSQTIKNPMMKLVLDDNLTQQIRDTIKNTMKEVKFKQIIDQIELNFEKNNDVETPQYEAIMYIHISMNKCVLYNITTEHIGDVYNLLVTTYARDIVVTNKSRTVNTDKHTIISFKLNNYGKYDEIYEHVMTCIIKGIKNITNVKEIEVNKESFVDGEYIHPLDKERYKNHKNTKHEIRTIGSNIAVSSVLNGIDIYKSYSNDIWEMYSLFGVEVARKCIIKEISQILGEGLNPIHATLLADAMTNEGILVSVDRHGQNKIESGPLGRATFEETVIQLTNASIFNDKDNMEGVSANVMFGQFIKSGTNFSKVVFDNDKFMNIIDKVQHFDEKVTIIDDYYDFDDSLFKFNYVFFV